MNKTKAEKIKMIKKVLFKINDILEPLGRRMVFEDGTHYPVNGEVVHFVKTEVLVKVKGWCDYSWSIDELNHDGVMVHGSLGFILSSLLNTGLLLQTVHSKKDATIVKPRRTFPRISKA